MAQPDPLVVPLVSPGDCWVPLARAYLDEEQLAAFLSLVRQERPSASLPPHLGSDHVALDANLFKRLMVRLEPHVRPDDLLPFRLEARLMAEAAPDSPVTDQSSGAPLCSEAPVKLWHLEPVEATSSERTTLSRIHSALTSSGDGAVVGMEGGKIANAC